MLFPVPVPTPNLRTLAPLDELRARRVPSISHFARNLGTMSGDQFPAKELAMTSASIKLPAPRVYGLHHSAYRCRDAEQTRGFYEDTLGFPMKMALRNDVHPTTGEPDVFMHLFFDIGSHDDAQANYIAFFDVPDHAGDDPAELYKRRWGLDLHFAMGLSDHAALNAWQRKLEAADIEVEGPIDHGMFTSIYFHDPNGYRLEFSATNAAQNAVFAQHVEDAQRNMDEWNAWKNNRHAKTSAG
jgi:catechol 2,3-dioxygenase-like lactoylglutathione lyase family enzyme